jgi:hypothetical protein
MIKRTIEKLLKGKGYLRVKEPIVLRHGNKIVHVVNPNFYITFGSINIDGSIDLIGHFREYQEGDNPDWYADDYSISFGSKSHTGYVMIHVDDWHSDDNIETIEDVLEKTKWHQAAFYFSYPSGWVYRTYLDKEV